LVFAALMRELKRALSGEKRLSSCLTPGHLHGRLSPQVSRLALLAIDG
jgi:hypothetical protein